MMAQGYVGTVKINRRCLLRVDKNRPIKEPMAQTPHHGNTQYSTESTLLRPGTGREFMETQTNNSYINHSNVIARKRKQVKSD
jgi:hypothetical protein